MDYPAWAPQNLVTEHYDLMSKTASERFTHDFDPDKLVTDLINNPGYKYLSPSQAEKVRVSLYGDARSLPERERVEILGKLLTDDRMRNVWAALRRRVNHEDDFHKFWKACERGILGWRVDQKLSPRQSIEYFQKIHKLALDLSEMMSGTKEFHHYSANTSVDDETVNYFLDALNVSPSEFQNEDLTREYLRSVLNKMTPSIHVMLMDIAIKALEFSEEEHLVRKPNSENAPVHYFVRILSRFCSETYEQPLHEVVATTTAIVFDQENIDSDYVRKLVA